MTDKVRIARDVAACIAALCLAVFLIDASSFVEQARRDESQMSAGVQLALDEVNKSCAPGPCGTLAGLEKTVTDVGDLTKQTQLAVRHADQVSKMEMAVIPQWNAQVGETLGSINRLVDHVDDSVQSVAPVVANVDGAVTDARRFINAPELHDTLTNVVRASASAADGIKQADGILADGKEEADKIVHPPKKKLGFWGSIWMGAQAVHKLSPPLF